MAALPIIAAGTTTTHTHIRRRSSASANSTPRRTSQHSIFAQNVLMSKLAFPDHKHANLDADSARPASAQASLSHASKPQTSAAKVLAAEHGTLKPLPLVQTLQSQRSPISKDGVGAALSDTPAPSQPGSPPMYGLRSTTSYVSRQLTLAGRPVLCGPLLPPRHRAYVLPR